MKFSIITPTYNRLDKLKRCVGSIRGQDGAAYQHIVQDGQSSDGTPDWLKTEAGVEAYVEKDNGMYDAINKGWERANGDVLCWLNSDEQYLPGTLARVAEVFRRCPDIDYIQGHYIVVDADGLPLAARREIRLSASYIANSFLNAASCTMFFRRRLWDEGLMRLDETYRYAADMDLVLRLIRARRRYLYLNQYLSLFTMDGSNLSCDDEMLEETAQIQRKYGGSRLPIVRKAYRCCRYMERFLSGCYRRVPLAYDYALDERPTYRRVTADSVPSYFRTRP